MGKNDTKRLSGRHQYPVSHKPLIDRLKEVEGVVEVYLSRYFPTKQKSPRVKIKGFESLTSSYLVEIRLRGYCQKYCVRVEEEDEIIEEQILDVANQRKNHQEKYQLQQQ